MRQRSGISSPSWAMRATAPAGARPRPAPGCARRGASQVLLVPRARRLAVELAVLLGELADGHRLERGELRGDVVELAHRGAGSAAVLLFIVPPSFARAPCSRVVGMTASSPVEDKARAGESTSRSRRTSVRGLAPARCSLRHMSRRVSARTSAASSSRRSISARRSSALIGWWLRPRSGRVFGIVASTGGKRGPARETGQEIVTDLHVAPLTGDVLFSI
jgi:hypothetical protein